MINELKKLFFLLRIPEQRWTALVNFIVNPNEFDVQYKEEKLFQENLEACWRNKNGKKQ